MRSIAFGRPMLGPREKEAVQVVLEGPILTHGARVQAFEEAFRAFTGADFAVATSSCTAAMHLAYCIAGIGPGDEVVVPAQTHIATAHAVEYCGATPVFADSERRSGNVDLQAVADCITPRTRAIAVMHYLGVAVDMPQVQALARKHDLFVVEDCTLALGARVDQRHVGVWGDVGCFSFYPIKHITTAEGGMLITRHRDMAEKARQLRAFGIDRPAVQQRTCPGMYDVPMLGFNYRLTEIGAALGCAQMARLPEFLERRCANHACLTAGLAELEELDTFVSNRGPRGNACYCHAILLDERWRARRPQIIEALRDRGVGTSLYYPRAVPHMSYYREKYGSAHDVPVAADISASSIALPVGPHLDFDDMAYILASIKEALVQVK